MEEELHPLEKSVPLYIITATYPRLEQLAELTRLGQTLKHVKNMRWIVADDAAVPTKQVMGLLYRLNITYKYILGIKLYYYILIYFKSLLFNFLKKIILGQMPKRYWSWEAQPKGVTNRNNALNWIINHSDQVINY